MMKACVLAVVLGFLAASVASADLCIPVFGPWWDDCDPSQGEPAPWCLEWPDGQWFQGNGATVEWVPVEVIWQRIWTGDSESNSIVPDGDDHDGGDPDGVGME